MKYAIVIVALFIFSCNDDKIYFDKILKSLEKNYTVQKIPKKDILFCWDIKSSTFTTDSIEYRKGINNFYKQKIPFIKYLLINKNNNNRYDNWIVTKDPCSSKIENGDFISNSKGVIILIDNLFCNEKKDIIINDYIDKIKFKDIEKIISEKEDQGFEELRKCYKKYIQKIK